MTSSILISAVVLSMNLSPVNELFDAVKLNDFEKVEHVVATGQDVNATDHLGMTPLMYAARHQDGKMLDYLISKGADVNVQNNVGATAIFVAARNGNLATVAKLISAGADLAHRNANGQTVRDVARLYEHSTIEQLITDHIRAKRS